MLVLKLLGYKQIKLRFQQHHHHSFQLVTAFSTFLLGSLWLNAEKPTISLVKLNTQSQNSLFKAGGVTSGEFADLFYAIVYNRKISC